MPEGVKSQKSFGRGPYLAWVGEVIGSLAGQSRPLLAFVPSVHAPHWQLDCDAIGFLDLIGYVQMFVYE